MMHNVKEHMRNSKYIWDDVLFEVTTSCNLECPFCLNFSSQDNKEYISLENFKLMIDKIKGKVGALQISGGEPFLHPDIMSMLEYLIGNNLSFHINTNGMLVTDKILDVIVNYPQAHIQFSLDGANAETNDLIRCSGHFDKVILLMSKLKEKGFRRGTVKMVVNRRNYHQVQEFFFLAMKYNFIPAYAFVLRSGRAHVNWEELYMDDALKCAVRNDIHQLIDVNMEYLKKFGSNQLILSLKNKNINYINQCRFNWEFFKFGPVIHTDGSVQPCQGLFQKEFCIGNLIEQSPEEIIDSENPLVSHFIGEVRRRKEHLDNKICRGCFLNNMCDKGCIAESYNSGDFYGRPMSCGMRKQDFFKNALEKRRSV